MRSLEKLLGIDGQKIYRPVRYTNNGAFCTRRVIVTKIIEEIIIIFNECHPKLNFKMHIFEIEVLAWKMLKKS